MACVVWIEERVEASTSPEIPLKDQELESERGHGYLRARKKNLEPERKRIRFPKMKASSPPAKRLPTFCSAPNTKMVPAR
ncbi:hypothetical protein KFK09_024089 [Dendrobium nobile]|uniref:Uncharacterized protein n=1 Tax=Dendrobium nobile TaxID=94219 RepID=A0A8T3ACW1_DENNO|nr:hypothetical protein KFK09_024089 [Dendrobium nobile]